MSEPASAVCHVLSTLVTQPPLCVGQTIFTKIDGQVISHVNSGFLRLVMSDDDVTPPGVILMVTGGTEVKEGDMFYRAEPFTDDTYLGRVLYVINDVVFIEMCGVTRDEVCNLLKAQTGQQCAPTLYKGEINSLYKSRALMHRGCGLPAHEVTITGFQRIQEAFRLFFSVGSNITSANIMGTLVTGIQRGGSRLLEAYGPVCSVTQDGNAVIGMLAPAIQQLQQQHFRGRTLCFLTPILPRESADEWQQVTSPTPSRPKMAPSAMGRDVADTGQASEAPDSDTALTASLETATATNTDKPHDVDTDSGYTGGSRKKL